MFKTLFPRSPMVNSFQRIRAFTTVQRPLIVQKFGGTSLGSVDKLEKVLRCVQSFHGEHRVCAVVSAMSSHDKMGGTTSLLLNAAEAAIANEPFHHFLQAIDDIHLPIVYNALTGSNRHQVREEIHNEMKVLGRFLESLSVIRELSGRSHNLIIGAGERLSANVVAGYLRENNVPAEATNLSHILESLDPKRVDANELAKRAISDQIQSVLSSDPDVIPVVTGYFGHVSGGIVHNIGRGYSDLTSALAAAGCQAKALQVWKESDGIFTGNPTKIDNARLVSHVSATEAAELTYFGNEVLHPYVMECTIKDNVPIHILNTFKPESKGTVVDPEYRASRKNLHKGIMAVTSKKGVVVVSLSSNRKYGSMSFLAKVFQMFAHHEVRVDLISTSETNLSITLHESASRDQLHALRNDLSTLGDCDIMDDRAIVSVIGQDMKSQVGTAAELCSALSEHGINLEMIAQGASEINMSVVIANRDADRAIKVIHERFLEQESSSDSSESSE